MNILNIEHISKIFGDKVIFDDISYGVHDGDTGRERSSMILTILCCGTRGLALLVQMGAASPR